MSHEIKNLNRILEDINDFDKLLTERISDLHEIKGMMQARHAYIFYRKLLWEIRDKITSSSKEIKL